jgi:hypothetical protein
MTKTILQQLIGTRLHVRVKQSGSQVETQEPGEPTLVRRNHCKLSKSSTSKQQIYRTTVHYTALDNKIHVRPLFSHSTLYLHLLLNWLRHGKRIDMT